MKSDKPEDMLKKLQENSEKWFAQIGEGVDKMEYMTRNEVLEMNPGRELDALVAEKVMGWTHKVLPVTDFASHSAPYWVSKDETVRVPALNWSPSTKISVAWEVEIKYENTHLIKTPTRGYTFHIQMPYKKYQADGATAPEAICKAALLAVLEG